MARRIRDSLNRRDEIGIISMTLALASPENKHAAHGGSKHVKLLIEHYLRENRSRPYAASVMIDD
jgi:hypothetical protein